MRNLIREMAEAMGITVITPEIVEKRIAENEGRSPVKHVWCDEGPFGEDNDVPKQD